MVSLSHRLVQDARPELSSLVLTIDIGLLTEIRRTVKSYSFEHSVKPWYSEAATSDIGRKRCGGS